MLETQRKLPWMILMKCSNWQIFLKDCQWTVQNFLQRLTHQVSDIPLDFADTDTACILNNSVYSQILLLTLQKTQCAALTVLKMSENYAIEIH